MTEFADKLDGLIEDIHTIRMQAVQTNADSALLSARLNGTVEHLRTHLSEADTRQKSLDNIARILVVQIVTFAFFCGGIVWMVNHNSEEVKKFSNHCAEFEKHIVKAEARWSILQIPTVNAMELTERRKK